MYTVPQLADYSESELDKAFGEITAEMYRDLETCNSEADVETFRIKWLGRKSGILTKISEAWLKGAPKEARRDVGLRFNGLRQQVEEYAIGSLAIAKGETVVPLGSAA